MRPSREGGVFGDATIRRILRLRWVIVAVFVGLVAGSALILPTLPVELGITKLLEPNPEELDRVSEIYRRVPPNVIDAIVVLTFDRELDEAALTEVGRIGAELRTLSVVDDVLSLATVHVMPAGGHALPRPFPDTVEGSSVQEAAWSHPLMRRTLISQDRRSTLIRIRAARELPALTYDQERFLDELETAVPRIVGSAVHHRILGGPIVQRAIKRHLLKDIIWTVGLEILIFAALLPLLFRTVRGSLLPLLVVVGAVVINFGWMAVFRLPLAIIDVAIPGLIVIIGLCDAIHMVHRFEEAYAETRDKRAAIHTMFKNIGRACLYTSLTTGIGFASLIVTNHDTVVAFGMKSAAAVVVTFVIIVTVIPAALMVWPVRAPVRRRAIRVSWLDYGRPKLTFTALAAAIGFAAVGIAKVRVDSHWLEELPRDDPVLLNIQWFEEQFTGLISVEALVEGELSQPDVFRAVEQIEATLAAEAGVLRIESWTMWIREALGNPEGELDDAQLTAGAERLRLAGRAFPHHLVDSDLQNARVVLYVRDVGANRLLKLRDEIIELAREVPPNLMIEPAGYTLMASRSTQTVIGSMSESLFVSILAITLLIAWIYRSFRIALWSLVPNIMPLAVALGLSGWLGIELRIGGALIYCLGLGLAVDDTIHLITRYSQEEKERPTASRRELLQRTLQSTGKALITTSTILGVGTLCHLTSSFRSMNNVGILLFTVVVAALAADLWVLPHLLQRTGPGKVSP